MGDQAAARLSRDDVVRETSLGERVAEEEAAALASYFVETEQWRQVWNGQKDVILAPKGGSKSAIYSMLFLSNDLRRMAPSTGCLSCIDRR